jgi:hypothetical protein
MTETNAWCGFVENSLGVGSLPVTSGNRVVG